MGKKDQDYGYFGHGLSGYAHYQQTFHSTFPGGGSRTSRRGRNGQPTEGKAERENRGAGQGCLIFLIAFLILCVAIVMIFLSKQVESPVIGILLAVGALFLTVYSVFGFPTQAEKFLDKAEKRKQEQQR